MTDKIQCGGLIRRENLCLLEIQGYDLLACGKFDILELLGNAGISLSYLAAGNGPDGLRSMSLCVAREHLPQLRTLMEDIQKGFAPQRMSIIENTMVLTVYGPHFYEKASVAGVVYGALRREEIYTHSLNSSVNSISLVINESDGDRTIRCLKTRISWPE